MNEGNFKVVGVNAGGYYEVGLSLGGTPPLATAMAPNDYKAWYSKHLHNDTTIHNVYYWSLRGSLMALL